jgi:hypothetical protein
MSKRQLQIKGTERKQDPDVEAAADAYREAHDTRMSHTKVEKQKKLELIAVMQARKLKKYKFDDAEGEELEVAIEDKLDVSVRRTGEAAIEIGEGIESPPSDDPSIPHGLIAEAEKAMSESNVEETEDGDVGVPDKAAPKSKRKGKKSS